MHVVLPFWQFSEVSKFSRALIHLVSATSAFSENHHFTTRQTLYLLLPAGCATNALVGKNKKTTPRKRGVVWLWSLP